MSLAPGTVLPPSGLHAVLDAAEALAAHNRLVVVLDEFQDIRGIPEGDELLGEMRGRIQQQRAMPYILAGSIRHEMEKVFTSSRDRGRYRIPVHCSIDCALRQ